MADYAIGSLTLPGAGADGRALRIYFAHMPSGGEVVARAGEEGLHQLASMIQDQLLELHDRKQLTRFLNWLVELTAAAEEFEELSIQIKNSVFRHASYTHWRSRDERLFLQSEDDVAAYLGYPNRSKDFESSSLPTSSGPGF